MTEKFGPNVAEAGSLLANKFGEEAKAKRNEAAIALEEAEKAKAENNNETNRALVKQARDNFETASREAKEWETGGNQRLIIDSALNVISTALAGRPAAEVVASGLSPAVNNQIKKATTDAKGNVKAVNAGTATITATLGKVSATFTVTVKNPSITAKADSSVIYTKSKTTTKINVAKDGVTGNATFKSSNTKVATVSANGTVKAKKAGKVNITVQVGNCRQVVKITVKKPTMKLTKSSAKLKKGKKVTIKVKAAPVSKVTFKSSNKKVATVSSKGVVKAKKKGTATITVKCNGITRKFKITVK